MKTIIIDDDASSVDVLAEKLGAYSDVKLIGTASTGKRGLELIAKQSPDVVFLDVELPDMSGIDFLEHLNNDAGTEDCRIVMYTGHPQYMLPSFRGNAFDYLLKPIDDAELQSIMERISTSAKKDPESRKNGIARDKKEDKLLFYTNSVDFRLVQIRNIGAFMYNHDLRLWEVIISERAEPIRLKRNVNNETILATDPNFVQVSQRHIINKNYLMKVSDNICRLYPPFDNIDNIKVGRLFRKKLIEQFNSL